jgi:hypothetical protein
MANQRKLKVGFLNAISAEWFHLHKDKLEQVSDVRDADYIIYESNGDPIEVINGIKSKFSNFRKKLVFILSGDQNAHIDDECIWFCNAVHPVRGLAKRQTQIFVTNPAIFKFYLQNKSRIQPVGERGTNIYFKGTIWQGMRTEMNAFFSGREGCKIVENNNYWNWRFQYRKPTQDDIEATAFESYAEMMDAKLILCPKGNGNSSMRIVEAIGCGAIPVLINDFSAPFGVAWDSMALVFDTRIHTWDVIYEECEKLLNDEVKMAKMQMEGMRYFEDVVFGDYKRDGCGIYKDLNTVCYGFSGGIVKCLSGFASAI